MTAIFEISSFKESYSSIPHFPSGTFVTKDSRKLEIYEIEDKDVKAINTTLKAWKEILMDRVGNMRQLHSTENTSETKKKLQEDLEAAESYKELVSRFDTLFSEVFKKNGKSEKGTVSFKALRDQDNNIQALCSLSIKENHVYLGHIFSAPWNLKMNASINEEHKPLVTKGCGTLLIANCYQEAQKWEKAELRLKPLSNSYTYYKDYLGMNEDSQNDEFFYTVNPFKIPEILTKRLSEISK